MPSEHTLATRACDLGDNLLSSLPPCVVSAVIKTWCNGWVTSRRFKDDDLGCIFGCAGGEHSIEHYAVCSVCSTSWTRLSFVPSYNGPLGFMAFGEENLSIKALRCLHIYAVYTVVVAQNARRELLPGGATECHRRINAGWKFILGKSDNLRRHVTFVKKNARALERGEWQGVPMDIS